MGSISIESSIDVDIECLIDKYPVVYLLVNQLKDGCDLSINGRSIFDRYDDVLVTVYEDVIVFVVSRESYVFENNTFVFRNDCIERYDLKVW